ncbi:MAG: polyribonucleotide nucleotidyltransferase [bacterium]|nr:polyribonucleotide nucleotidyltransferase [bacterium]
MIHKEEISVGGRTLSIEIGKVAKQADGAAWVRYGDSIVLAAAVSARVPMETDFVPLMVDYREKLYASGRIPGGFFKREGRPTETEVLTSRLIDRPIRPLFPKNYRCDTQVLISVLSAETDNLPDVVASIAASAALTVSDIPFDGPFASVRVGFIDGEYVLNPSAEQLEKSRMELVVAGTYDSITMVEGGSKEISEDEMVGAIEFAHAAIKPIVELQNRIREAVGVPKREHLKPELPEGLEQDIINLATEPLRKVSAITERTERRTQKRELEDKILLELTEKYPESELLVMDVLDSIYKKVVRKMVQDTQHRLDGRGCDEIRHISCETNLLPRAHGSALFTRGQTQALATVTLGTKEDEQRIDGLAGDYFRRYMFHYNFPPFSTGETKKNFSTSRREVGHGNLAERALQAVLPTWDDFPYTIRVVSDILESNGSSSMASVCAGLLALMDAGVPVNRHVAGIAMGLISEGENPIILTDILGDEDRLGDMDFKVAGTRQGITAFQMDIKIKGLSTATMREALTKAKNARFRILDIMEEAMPKPNSELSEFAPRIITIHVPVESIGAIIGPGGKVIRDIVEKSGAKVDIMDDGRVNIASIDSASGEIAKRMVERIIEAPEIGKVYKGIVKKIADFGAFVEIIPGRDGLLHISEIERTRINSVSDVLNVGDEIEVKLLSISPEGKMDLSRRALLIEQDATAAGKPIEPYLRQRPPRPEGGNRDRGGYRDRDGGHRGGGRDRS